MKWLLLRIVNKFSLYLHRQKVTKFWVFKIWGLKWKLLYADFLPWGTVWLPGKRWVSNGNIIWKNLLMFNASEAIKTWMTTPKFFWKCVKIEILHTSYDLMLKTKQNKKVLLSGAVDQVWICRYKEANLFGRESIDPAWELTKNGGWECKESFPWKEREECKFVVQGDEGENSVIPLRK